METKARELGIGGKLFYLFPSGGASVTTPSTAFSEFLSPHNLQEAVAAVKAGKVAASQMVDSQHTGHHPYYWGGGAAGLARHLMNEPDLKDVLEIGACNTETNAKQQAQNRAMMEAGDLNDWFNVVDIAKRLHLRASSFCMAQADHANQRRPMDYDVGTLAVYAVPAGEAEQSQGNGRPVYATAVGGGANGGGGETKESSNV